MSNNTINTLKKNNTNESTVGGIVLVAIGLFFLLRELIPVTLPEITGFLMMPALAAVFLTAGMLTRNAGWFIPSGIVGGIGVGIFAETNPLSWLLLSDLPEGAPFMFAFAAGWFSIVILTALFADSWQWWAIIPATIFAMIGATVVFGGLFGTMLALLGKGWPLILIAIGVKALLETTARETSAEK